RCSRSSDRQAFQTSPAVKILGNTRSCTRQRQAFRKITRRTQSHRRSSPLLALLVEEKIEATLRDSWRALGLEGLAVLFTILATVLADVSGHENPPIKSGANVDLLADDLGEVHVDALPVAAHCLSSF